MSSEKKVSYDLTRFAGIKRDYSPEEVERLRGSIKINYSMCETIQKIVEPFKHRALREYIRIFIW